MNQSPFTVNKQTLDRRSQNRRHLQDETAVYPPRTWGRPAGLLASFAALSLLVWQWRYVVYAPVWLARAHWADRSDLYLGKTNGISNRTLVQQARNYLTDIDHVDASGNVTTPEVLRPQGVHLDMAWFLRHAPDSVDFNPFLSSGGKFVVTWVYVPDCQEAVRKSPRTDTDWYTLRGRPCYPVCKISVLLAPDLRLTSIAMNPV